MKVLFTNDAPLIKYGMAAGFSQAGHQVKIMYGPEEQLWGIEPEDQVKRLSTALEDYRPDLVFTEGHPRIEPSAICETVKKFGIPHFYWAIEDPVCTDLTIATYAPRVDYIFTTTVECIPKYNKIGQKAEVLLFGCNHEFHRFVGINQEYQYDLVLVASNYSSRYEEAEWFVMPLVRSGYKIKIWGIWWDDATRPVNLLKYPHVYGGILPYEMLPVVYSSAKIVLGMNCDDSSKTQTSMRPYEVLACGGGLYVGHYTKAQEYLFKDMIYQPRNTSETLTTVRRILAKTDAERKAQAKRGQLFVYQNHSYAARARQILEAYNKIVR
ncbi:MAG TPA: glycosyltransferase [Bacillota bacterium]|jgi:spore maturation protein CgeB|nr:glycosyltransferase [Bacillota bacterium]HOL10590.1 glycosyltransferase [Bacillota bacterium]HPO98292.1 glycosyltransferase [Bacillota bacterium]